MRKTNSTIFEHAFFVANTKKDEVIMIRDSIEIDEEGVLNFGIKAIYCNFKKAQVACNDILYQFIILCS